MSIVKVGDRAAGGRKYPLIGVAGWSYPDWQELLAVGKAGRQAAELEILAGAFDLIEMTSSYFHPVEAKASRDWLRRIEHNPRLRFTARLWNDLVRQRSRIMVADVRMVKRGMEPLLESRRLVALVMQFSRSFRYSDSSQERIVELLDWFIEYPLVVEVHHRSWQQSDLMRILRQRGVAVAQIDQPQDSTGSRFEGNVPGTPVYFRLDGRNRQSWLQEDAGRDERFDYYYSRDELEALIPRMAALQNQAPACYVAFNNYPRGQAIANAAEMSLAFTGKKAQLPEIFWQRFSGSAPPADRRA